MCEPIKDNNNTETLLETHSQSDERKASIVYGTRQINKKKRGGCM